jgi:murein DD-endopeptidase MepM/ murein hydrolase activator NlpD
MTNLNKIIIFSSLIFLNINIANAETIEELKSKINDKNDAIQRLEQEIKQYQLDIDALGQEANSLKNNLKSLDISKKKLEASIKITENKIAAKNLEIKELSLQIGDKNTRISDGRRVISQSLYKISQTNSASVIETLLGQKSLSEILNNSDQLAILQGNMQEKIRELEDLKENLEDNKKLTEQKKRELVSLTNDLKNETKIIADTVKEKNAILQETKNAESNYKKLLTAKQIEKEAFEKEILEFEANLKTIIDPNSIPVYNTGILNWPLDHIRITQYFGNTEFAARNPQAYAGKGHNGVDFGAYIGTPVKSALSGVVVDSGNMDLANKGKCKNYGSYGKWILIKHNNGLSTLYAHLSLIKAVKGEVVSSGEVIAYSGNTGTSFGPHLHFTVFASDGVTIAKLVNSKNCKNAVIPVAPRAAYLNPLSYLPD